MAQRILLISIALVVFSSMVITEDNTLATEIPKEFSAPDPECDFDKQLLAQSKMLAGTTFMLQRKMGHQPNMELAKEALIKNQLQIHFQLKAEAIWHLKC